MKVAPPHPARKASPTSPPSKHGGEVGLVAYLIDSSQLIAFKRKPESPTSPPCFVGGEVATSLRVAGEGGTTIHCANNHSILLRHAILSKTRCLFKPRHHFDGFRRGGFFASSDLMMRLPFPVAGNGTLA